MKTYGLAALIAATAAPLAAQPAAPAATVQPSIDTAAERQALRLLSSCLATSRPRWARQALAQPYLSKDQARVATEAISGQDKCVHGPQAEFVFRTSTLVGSLAEHFLATDLEKADSKRVAAALNSASPLNASEDFGLCVAAGNPAAARRLSLSDPGSPAEAEAVGQLSARLKPCFAAGETPSVDLQALRALVSTALYRAVTSVLASRS
ncbi:MAG: hypothetical protein JWO25_3155 [Alphaproteobacteria bacterium]|nr:hypothetical protein [Alphaproteobacteria bacterium]